MERGPAAALSPLRTHQGGLQLPQGREQQPISRPVLGGPRGLAKALMPLGAVFLFAKQTSSPAGDTVGPPGEEVPMVGAAAFSAAGTKGPRCPRRTYGPCAAFLQVDHFPGILV